MEMFNSFKVFIWASTGYYSIFFSFFFLVITFLTDLTLYMVTQPQDWLFMIAGFLVWIQVLNPNIPKLDQLKSYHSKLKNNTF